MTVAITLIKNMYKKVKKNIKKRPKKNPLTKTTNYAMMILDIYYYDTRCVGPEAAEAYLKLLSLNPFGSLSIL